MCLVGWRESKINGVTQVFSSQTYKKVFSSKWKENWREKLDIIFGWKYPCAITHGLYPCCFSSSTLPFFFFLDVVCLFFFFFFSFDLLGRLVQYSFFFLLPFFFWFRCDFLNGHDFYFLINLGDYFYLFTTFLVLTGYHFLIRVYA